MVHGGGDRRAQTRKMGDLTPKDQILIFSHCSPFFWHFCFPKMDDFLLHWASSVFGQKSAGTCGTLRCVATGWWFLGGRTATGRNQLDIDNIGVAPGSEIAQAHGTTTTARASFTLYVFLEDEKSLAKRKHRDLDIFSVTLALNWNLITRSKVL